MENATKALLIAAAVLVAILIISLGLAVYNKASNATDTADLTAAEIQAQNEKFVKYEGKSKRGNEVNALLETVMNYNITTNSTVVTVDGTGATGAGGGTNKVSLSADGKSISTKADTSKLYDIECTRTDGVVSAITITNHT